MKVRDRRAPSPTLIDDEDDRDYHEEDAVDVDVERRRRSLVARRALSFPVERTFLSFCSLRLGLGVVSTHGCATSRDGRKLIINETPSARRDVITHDYKHP